MIKYGIWCGKDATVAIVEDFRVAFLRMKNNEIASILTHTDFGTIAAVYGLGVNSDASAVYCVKNPNTGIKSCNLIEGANKLELHSNDTFDIKENGDMVYTSYNEISFNLKLSQEIDMSIFNVKYEIDNSMSIAKRMVMWNINKFFQVKDGFVNAGIDTEYYSIFYNISVAESKVYCRVGQNGFCDKGRAMLSTTCIRRNESRMIENNLNTLDKYRPIEDYFILDGCSFPPDGGWYWSVKQVTDDVIYLNGCGGDIYKICRKSMPFNEN